MALYFCIVLFKGDSFSGCLPTLVEPDAVFFALFLASRDDSDALFPPLLRVAPPLISRMDAMFASLFMIMLFVDLTTENGAFPLMIAADEVAAIKTIMEHPLMHSLLDLIGLMMLMVKMSNNDPSKMSIYLVGNDSVEQPTLSLFSMSSLYYV